VHKFLCDGTLEERIDEMIEDKKHLQRTLWHWRRMADEMTTEQLKEMSELNREAVGGMNIDF